jgi:hypothetical protein
VYGTPALCHTVQHNLGYKDKLQCLIFASKANQPVTLHRITIHATSSLQTVSTPPFFYIQFRMNFLSYFCDFTSFSLLLTVYFSWSSYTCMWEVGIASGWLSTGSLITIGKSLDHLHFGFIGRQKSSKRRRAWFWLYFFMCLTISTELF